MSSSIKDGCKIPVNLMLSLHNNQILLKRRPTGWVTLDDFELVQTPIPSLLAGQVLVKNHFLSLDPYMRSRMNDAKSYAEPMKLGEVMVGGTVGEVIESQHPKFAVGDQVVGMFGWQTYGVSNGRGLQKVGSAAAPSRIPLSAWLGAAGMPGVTAYAGLFEIGQPKAGETVLVSAAAGAVGSVVGQLAKLHGCRAVGIAGGPEKCAYVCDQLGFDACADYKSPEFRAQLKAAVPNGVDVYFENVGGPILDTVLARMNNFSRIPVCGLISDYNATEAYGIKNFVAILSKRIKVQGFIVTDFAQIWAQTVQTLADHIEHGRIKTHETIAEGLENAPAAFIGMLKGANLGKQLVRL